MKRKNKTLLAAINLIGTQAQVAETIGVALSTLNDATRYSRQLPMLAVINLSLAIDLQYMPWEIDPMRDWGALKEFCQRVIDLAGQE